MPLNKEQQEAVDHIDGPCCVTAIPGSGKTRVLVERTANLISKGIHPSSILCITFTNKASEEMSERVVKRLGTDSLPKGMFIGTFHKFSLKVVKQFYSKLGYSVQPTVIDDKDSKDLMAQIARKLEYELDKKKINYICNECDNMRERLETRSERIRRFEDYPHYLSIAEAYLSHLDKNNLIDFSGILYKCHELLYNNTDILERLQRKFKYASVDETQDTNMIQYRIISKLMSHTGNIFIVGDPDQSIFSWRGAEINNILDFSQKSKVIKLNQNYRSTPQILSAADRLIKKNAGRLETELLTPNPDGPVPDVFAYGSDSEEAMKVAQMIHKVAASDGYGSIAVLYRLNKMSRQMELALMQANIPYVVIGARSFFDRMEVRDILSMLRFACNPKDGIAFHRFCNKPKRGIGNATIGKIENFSDENNIDILSAIKDSGLQSRFGNKISTHLNDLANKIDQSISESNGNVGLLVEKLINNLNYYDYLKTDPDTEFDRRGNVEELIRDATDYSDHGGSLSGYLDQVALYSSSDKNAGNEAVSLMTLHASKGLEFRNVFMIGCEDDILPHEKAVNERDDGIEEERRLCYVGMTRAKYRLNMSYAIRRDGGRSNCDGFKEISRFIFETGLLRGKNKKDYTPYNI